MKVTKREVYTEPVVYTDISLTQSETQLLIDALRACAPRLPTLGIEQATLLSLHNALRDA